jgi:uncharacterized protein (TIGR03437 family)
MERYFRLTLILAGLGLAFGQTPAVLNLSHDLVANGIAAQNMTPNTPTLDARPLFQAGINYASKNNIPMVIADPGSYYFLTLNSQFQHVYLNAISNVTVDLQHSDLYFAHGNIMAIDINEAVNLTLRNFTVDYTQLPFTQVTVTAVNATAQTIGVQQLESYPLPSYLNSVAIPSNYSNDGYFAYIFRNGVQLRTTGRMPVSSPVSDSSIQITGTDPWTTPSQLATIQPGDILVLELRAGIGTISSANSTGLTVQNVSIYASGFIGVHTSYGSAITVDHVQVIPRPGTDRMISTNADGIHLGYAGANNVITNNTVKRGCDDAIAIDGQWSAIVNAANTGASVQVMRHNNTPIAVGESLDFINVTSAATIGTATVVSENPPVSQQAGTGGELITLTLDHAITLATNGGVTPTDPNLRGNGTVITGNLVEQQTFGRGIYPAGVANITIANNMIEATNEGGILVEQDEGLSYDYKTGPSSGITIENNIVNNALGFGIPSNPVLTLAGAINVVAYNQNFNWVTATSLSNISITGNFVTNSVATGIRMENVNGGQLTGNTVLNYALQPTDYLWYLPAGETTAQIEADFKQPVLVVNSTGVTNANNTTSGSWVANLSNADGSYRLAPGSIATAWGQNLTAAPPATAGATLPTTLGGVTGTVKDSAGVSRPASLYYASSGQVNYVVPLGTAGGMATAIVGTIPSAAFIGAVAPSLYSANGNGIGVAAAFAVLASASGTQTVVPVFQCGSSGCTAASMSLGAATDILVVELYGTGIQGRSSLSNVVVEIGGVPAQVVYAGAQSQYPGLDQVNVYVPRSLAGAGEVPVVVTVDGVTANVVTISIQ